MFYLWTFVGVVAGYLLGSISYARWITRLVTGKDITAIGNKNPGTSNVIRSVSFGWGALVGFLDMSKAFFPMLVAKWLIFNGEFVSLPFEGAGIIAVFFIGVAAMWGHARPVFYQFKGGGSIGTLQGVYFFFVPVEYLSSMVVAGFLTKFFFKNQNFKYTRMTPVLFTTITPFLTLALSLSVKKQILFFPNSAVFSHIGVGYHHWSLIAGVFMASLTILAVDFKTLTKKILHKTEEPGAKNVWKENSKD